MDKIHEIAGDGGRMPRFDDGMVNMAGLIRVVTESLVNEAMDARADEAREGGSRRNGYRERKLVTGVGAINLGIPELRGGSYFPEDLVERCSRADRAAIAAASEMATNGVSAGKAKRDADHGHRPHGRQPGAEDMLVAGRVGRRPAETRPVRRRLPLHLARRNLHQVQGRGPRAVDRAGSRHRRRLGRVQAPSGARRHRHQALRRLEVVPAFAARTRGRRRDLRRQRRPRGPQARDPEGLPGRRAAALHRASDAQRRRQRADRAEKGAVPGILQAVFAERDPELVREPCQLATARIGGF